MSLKIERWNVEVDGEMTESAIRSKLESWGYRVTRYVYPPGTYFPSHTHGVDKIDAVLSGQFEMTMAGQNIVLEAGDMLAVPRGKIHSAKVLGKAPVVSLDAVKRS